MPATLRSLLKPGKTLTISFDSGSRNSNDKISSLFLEAVTLESWIEAYRGLLFAEITKKNASTTIAMLEATTSSSHKAQLIEAGIKANLSDKEYKIVMAVFELADRCLKNRNVLGHSLMGSVKEYPDRLMLMEAKYFVTANADIKFKFANKTLTDKDGEARQAVFLDNAMLYTISDLESMIRDMRYVQTKMELLDGIILQAPTAVRDIAFSSLAIEPQIKAIVERENK